MLSTLEIVLIFLATSVAVVALARKLQQPPLLGYLLAGILIGPHAIGLVPDAEGTRYLAEFGVVFLMFSIGLEFNLARLLAMRATVFGFGMAQVAATTVVGFAAGLAMGLGWQAGIALGGALAMSSTAIVVKLLSERVELETAHGRDVMGVLLFQDLAVVPFLIIVPALSKDPGTLASTLALAVVKAVVVLAVLLFAGRKAIRGWLRIVARRRSTELFTLNLLLLTLGLAYITEHAGLSLALGAFVAGMLISETEFRHQVEEDIKPFRDVLLGLFFVTIGMLLDVRSVMAQLGLVLFLTVIPVAAKFAIVAALGKAFNRAQGTAIRTGLALAQAGEFGFVLLAQAGGLKLVEPSMMDAILAAMLLSMLVSPFLIASSDKIAMRFARDEWLMKSIELTQLATRTLKSTKHVIICGYGRNGQALAKVLAAEKVDYLALDLDPERIQEASAAGDAVVYADASRRESLIAAGLMRAQAIVITYADLPSSMRILHHVQEMRPELPVVARVKDDIDMDKMRLAGAAEVVAETHESSLMLASHALLLSGVPVAHVMETVRKVRESRYGLLRGFFHGASDAPEDLSEHANVRMQSVSLPQGAFAVGRALASISAEHADVEVVSVRRRGVSNPAVNAELEFEAGDVVVLRGVPSALALFESHLLSGVR